MTRKRGRIVSLRGEQAKAFVEALREDRDALQRRVALWDAINAYAQACGGDTSNATVSDARMAAVADVEACLRLLTRVTP